MPWLLAAQEQKLQHKRSKDGSSDANGGGALSQRLPRLSPTAAGGLVGMISGDFAGLDESPDRSELHAQARLLMETIQTSLAIGDKIQDTKDGKTIGQIVATPEEGTNILLAQMRLDRVGLLGKGLWSQTNKITIGDNQYRYLPYLPLWWPEMDMESGKSLES